MVSLGRTDLRCRQLPPTPPTPSSVQPTTTGALAPYRQHPHVSGEVPQRPQGRQSARQSRRQAGGNPERCWIFRANPEIPQDFQLALHCRFSLRNRGTGHHCFPNAPLGSSTRPPGVTEWCSTDFINTFFYQSYHLSTPESQISRFFSDLTGRGIFFGGDFRSLVGRPKSMNFGARRRNPGAGTLRHVFLSGGFGILGKNSTPRGIRALLKVIQFSQDRWQPGHARF